MKDGWMMSEKNGRDGNGQKPLETIGAGDEVSH